MDQNCDKPEEAVKTESISSMFYLDRGCTAFLLVNQSEINFKPNSVCPSLLSLKLGLAFKMFFRGTSGLTKQKFPQGLDNSHKENRNFCYWLENWEQWWKFSREYWFDERQVGYSVQKGVAAKLLHMRHLAK